MTDDAKEDILSLYQEAAFCLEAASKESEKTMNIDITMMLTNCQRCAQLVKRVQSLETDAVRLEGLVQLHGTLCHHQEVLTAKINQLDNGKMSVSSTSKSSLKVDDAENTPTCSRRQAIEDTIISKGKLTFDDVAGLAEAKQTLKEAIIIPLQFPHLFTGGRKPWKRILLYGPPGTGKTRLAQAVASEIQSAFYCVSSSDLISSWVGESEKLIKELFVHATNQAGRSVVFIDEIDSLCRQRRASEEEHTRRIKTELLKQMEGADNTENTDKIFLLCATNCPWDLDSAFLRRFQKRIYIPLPDREARLALVKIHTQQNQVQLSEDDLQTLADKTEGFSGSDIASMTLGALFEPIRDLQMAQNWAPTEEGKLVPCEPDHPGSIKSSITSLPPDQVHPRSVTQSDFLKSLVANRNTVTSEELERFTNFTASFGQNG